MKRIGLLSDTHSYLDPQLRGLFDDCDEIWHAGDIGNNAVSDELKKWKPLKAVYGNIDGHELRAEFPEVLRFTEQGVDVMMIHIGGRPPRYAKGILNLIARKPPKLFICGHSHILCVKNDPNLNMLYMNPGAAGKHGFHKERTALRFSLDRGTIQDLELLKLGERKYE